MAEALLLDLGGTLVDGLRAADLCSHWARSGLRLEPRRVAAIIFRTDLRYMELEPGLWHQRGAEFQRRYWGDVHEAMGLGLETPPSEVTRLWGGHWRRYQDVPAALQLARRSGLRLGLVSNWDLGGRKVLQEAGLLDAFEVLAFSAELGWEKPDPRLFRWAADRLGLPVQACTYVGDNFWDDVVGARMAGMEAILLHRYPEWAALPSGPNTPVVTDLRQAVLYLGGRRGPRPATGLRVPA